MRLFVTGATGFVGRHLCPALIADGHQIKALVRSSSAHADLSARGVQPWRGDVTVPASIEGALEGIDAVVHLAGVQSARRPQTYLRVNAQGTANVAREAARAGVRRVVLMSSLAAQESGRVSHPSAVSWRNAETLAAEATGGAETDLVVLRPSLIYGADDGALRPLARVVMRGFVPSLPEGPLSLLHIDDAVAAITAALSAPAGPPVLGPLCLAEPEHTTWPALVRALQQALDGGAGRRVPVTPRIARALSGPLKRLSPALPAGEDLARVLEIQAGAWRCDPDEAMNTLGVAPTRRFDAAINSLITEWKRSGALE